MARAIALLGMFAAHVVPTTDALTGEATWVGEVFAGRSAALFAVLAGVGLALLTGGSSPSDSVAKLSQERRIIATRAAIIIAIGLLVSMWSSGVAIILVHYGVLFLLALPFLRLGARALAGLAAGWVLLAPVIYWYVQNVLRGRDVWGEGAGSALTGTSPAGGPITMDPPPRLWSSPGFTDLTDPFLLFLDLTVTGYYPLLLWPAYLLAGMAIGRISLRSAKVAWRLLAVGGVVAAVTLAVGRWVLASSPVAQRMQEVSGYSPGQVHGELVAGTHFLPLVSDPWWFLMTTPHQGSPLDLLHTIACAAAVLGACLLIARLRWLVIPLAGAGAMPLTLYVGHLAVLSAWRGVDSQGQPLWPGLDAFREVGPGSLLGALVVAALVLGVVKVLSGRRGPLEALTQRVATAVSR